MIFHFNHGTAFRFSDIRRFGLIRKGEADTYSGIGKLGPEPFDDSLTATYLQSKLGKRKKAMKECLLDQSVIAGIGNIYSDEILLWAKICPARSASSLSTEEWKRLAEIIPECLSFFIEKNRINADDYLETKRQDYCGPSPFQWKEGGFFVSLLTSAGGCATIYLEIFRNTFGR